MGADKYLHYDMEDVFSINHDAEWVIDEIYQKYGIVILAIVLDGADECRKTRRLIAEE